MYAGTGLPAGQDKRCLSVHTGDDIQISTEGQRFSSIMNRLKSGSEVRMEKVRDYERRLESGTYRVDSGDLAESIMRCRC